MEQHKNTTTASTRDGRLSARGFGILVATLVAVLLIYLALPRTVSALLTLPGRHLLADIRETREVELRKLETMMIYRRRAVDWSDSSDIHSELALTHLFMAEVGGRSPEARVEHLKNARDEIQTSLRHGPSNPHDWARLAYVQMLLEGPSEYSAGALVMSMLTARYEPDLIFTRLQLSLISWQFFSRSDQDLVRDQIQLAWRRSPDRVASLARRESWTGILRSVLAQNPESLTEFERLIAVRQ